MTHKSKIKLMRGYEVEWCKHIPIRDGEGDLDNATYGYRRFATMKEARAFALEVAKTAEFHTAEIREFKMEAPHSEFPSLYETEYVGEPVCVEEGDPVAA